MVQVPPTQFAQFTPDAAAGFPVDGESVIEPLLTLAVKAVTTGEPTEPELDVAAWDVVDMRNTRSVADIASPINRGTERRIASHLLERYLVEGRAPALEVARLQRVADTARRWFPPVAEANPEHCLKRTLSGLGQGSQDRDAVCKRLE
jgi:hypothetical protein